MKGTDKSRAREWLGSAWKISIWTALRKLGWIFNEGSPATGQCATGRNRETRRIEGTVPTRGNGSESEDNVRRGSTRRGAKAERSHCDSINDSVVVAMRDPVREALYGPLRRRDRILQRVIPSLYASFGVSKFQRLRHRCASRCPGHDTPVSQMKSLFDAPLFPSPRRKFAKIAGQEYCLFKDACASDRDVFETDKYDIYIYDQIYWKC